MKQKGLLAAAAGLTLAACGDPATAPDAVAPAMRNAPVAAKAADGEPIPGQYIVVFNDDVADPKGKSAEKVGKAKGRLKHAYDRALKGFAAELSDEAVAELRADPDVAYVEQDQQVQAIATQSPATWGLDRIDQRALPLNNTYVYGPTGAGVTAYIIDTGIRFDHAQFGGRASSGYDAVDGGSADDCNGHGTHVAGTVGGSTYGVAKGVSLVAVRVLNCSGSGTNSGVIAGINWVITNHAAGAPAVANMSLGGGVSSTLDQAVANAVADGVTFAVAAGNDGANACNYSPARAGAAITVGATTSSDARASYSNYGTCVDIFAPGSSITSSWYTSATATNTISGTSMATPHVAGAAALYLEGNKAATPAQVTSALTSNATPGAVGNPGTGSPNLLLYTGFLGGGTTPPTTPTLTASFTKSCTGFSCTFNASGSTGATTYAWAFSDGGTGSGVTFTRSFPSRRNYTVTLTTGNGTTTATAQTTVSCNKRSCQ